MRTRIRLKVRNELPDLFQLLVFCKAVDVEEHYTKPWVSCGAGELLLPVWPVTEVMSPTTNT